MILYKKRFLFQFSMRRYESHVDVIIVVNNDGD